MSKFSSKPARANTRAAIATVATRARTYEGHIGYERDAKSELYLLAVSNMVAESTFYESAGDRDDRFKQLVWACATTDPEWTAAFIPYLRETMQMRSAATVAAAHYVASGAPGGRQLVAAALKRPDEPAELLAYYAQEYGRQFPQPLKRGVADAVRLLYTERAALKYDGQSRAWRMGDVIDIVHPKPVAEWQSNLFRWLLDTRHNRADMTLPEGCETIKARAALEALSITARREALNAEALAQAGMTWESLSGWLNGPMDAEAWEAVIPSMGYMALLRNLRNFEQAGVGDTALAQVVATLSDPEQVARSRQFPLRFLSAYKNLASERFAWPLEQALDHSLANVPALKGRTLILVDVSGSMNDRLSQRSQLTRKEAAALFGVALAKRCDSVDLIAYDTNAWNVQPTGSALRVTDEVVRLGGGGTYTMQTLSHVYAGHDRVVILTDEQAHGGTLTQINCPIYTFNLGGYRVAHMAQGEKGSYAFGGLSDAAFRMLAMLDEGRTAGWPFVRPEAANS